MRPITRPPRAPRRPYLRNRRPRRCRARRPRPRPRQATVLRLCHRCLRSARTCRRRRSSLAPLRQVLNPAAPVQARVTRRGQRLCQRHRQHGKPAALWVSLATTMRTTAFCSGASGLGQAPRVLRARAARDSRAWRPASLLQRQGGGGCLMTTMTTRLISLPRPPRHQAAARRRRQVCRRRKRACRVGWRRVAGAAGRAGEEDFLGATTTRMTRFSGSLRARAACRNVAPVVRCPCPKAVLWQQQQQQQQELVAAAGPRVVRARTCTGLLRRRQASRR